MQRADVQSMTAPLRVTAPWKNTRGQNGVHVCGHVHEVRAYSGRENHRNIQREPNYMYTRLGLWWGQREWRGRVVG